MKFVESFALMETEAFLNVERDVLRFFGISEPVIDFTINIIYEVKNAVDLPQVRKTIVNRGTLNNILNSFIKSLRFSIESPALFDLHNTLNFPALAIIVSNSAILFTSGDLNVVGTLSTLAGAAADLRRRSK